MRHFVFAAAVGLILCATASAQRSLGYWFAAPGARTTEGSSDATIHLGGGGELALWKGVSAALEGGAVGRLDRFTDSVTGVGSLNGVYHFRPSRSVQVDPFATVGYSLFFRRGTANLVNFGGGVNYWFVPSLALRVEFRDHVLNQSPAAIHYWGFRFGFSFTEFR